MDETVLKNAFIALSKSSERSFAARFRDVFPDVQAALDAGVSRITARDELARLGLDINQNTFNSLLKRVRKERMDVPAAAPQHTRHLTPLPKAPATVLPSGKAPVLKPNRGSLFTAAENLELPDDWLTAELPPAISRSLTPEQKARRGKARDKLFHPSPYDDLSDDDGKAVLAAREKLAR